MNKKVILYLLTIFIVMIMILSLIMIDSSLDFFTDLPEYKNINNGDLNIDVLTEEVVLEVRDISYGFYAVGTTFSVNQDDRIHTYLVSETILNVGDIIRKGDYIDLYKTVPALTTGQIYNIEYKAESVLITVYNFENIRIKTNIDIYYFNLLKDFDNISIVIDNSEYEGKINEISHTVVNEKVDLTIDFLDVGNINHNLIEGTNIHIKFNVGVLKNVLSIPSGLNLKNGNLVKIITEDGIIETNVYMGIQGFDFIEITNKNFKPGYKIILEPVK